jgi:aminoglycoside phosphotransferase family enzyme/predicted kinase
MGTLRDDLSRNAREVRETHISWVFLDDDEVYKVKKPVDFGFLNFSTLPLRKAACEAEVRLNRRLAPDVYKGTVSVSLNEQGVHRLGGSGAVVDWAVQMRRLRDEHNAERLLEMGCLQIAQIDALARHLAAFHATARCDATTTAFGDPRLIEQNARDNFREAGAFFLAELGENRARELEHGQIELVAANAHLLRERMARGYVRDGHGDLKLEHCYFEGDRITVIDCIEFNDRFRFGDVCGDLAFLAMDLSAHHRVDLAERLLSTYATEANDFDLYALVDFYQSYRACVRAKVSHLLAQDEASSHPLRASAERNARKYLMLAIAEQHAQVQHPCVTAVGGMIASGKSTIADRLGSMLSAPIISSDRVRKHLVGVSATTALPEAAWQGTYSPEMSTRVYDEVFRRARVVLASGRSVVLDCSFRSQNERNLARQLAREFQVPFWFVECKADAAICRERLVQRGKAEHVSDAREDLFDEFSRRWEPVALDEQEHLSIDTGSPLDQSVAFLARTLPVWPTDLKG